MCPYAAQQYPVLLQSNTMCILTVRSRKRLNRFSLILKNHISEPSQVLAKFLKGEGSPGELSPTPPPLPPTDNKISIYYLIKS